MYNLHHVCVMDGVLDENKTRKFIAICDKIFSIESAHYFNNDTSEIIVGNKIRYIKIFLF